MKNKFIAIVVLFIGILLGVLLRHNKSAWSFIKKPILDFYNSPKDSWSKDFTLLDLKSSIDSNIQKVYYYKSKSNFPKPLIVSLHTWGGNYLEKDSLALICKQKDINYIHPNFRGKNNTINSCCSQLVLADIDDAISYAIVNLNVDTSQIYVIGASGGGYATLSTFMKSRHDIKQFSAWVPISDLIAWYHEGEIRNSLFTEDILNCTNSIGELNIENAKQKSPLYWNTPVEKLNKSKVSIYAGIFDGIKGSVPITHSINFYNKVLSDLSVSDSTKYVSNSEKLKLLEYRKPIGNYGYIGDRKIYLKKEFKNLSLVIFEGGHEILAESAIENLMSDNN